MSTKPLKPVLPTDVDTLEDSLFGGEGLTLDTPVDTVTTDEVVPTEVDTLADAEVPPPDPNNQILSTQVTTQQSNVTQEVKNMVASNSDDPETVKFFGEVSRKKSKEAGFAIVRGDVIAIESDGKIYPSRITGEGSIIDTDENLDATGRTGESATVKQSSSLLLSAFIVGGSFVGQTVDYDAANKVIDSVSTRLSITTSGNAAPALEPMSDTTCLFAAQDGLNNIYVQLLSSISAGSITSNTEDSVATSRNPQLIKVSDTSAIMTYIDTATDDLKMAVVTISGTTVTIGSEQDLHTATGSTSNLDVVRYGSTDFYAAIFDDDSDLQVLAFEWDGSTLTAGTAVEIESSTHGRGQACSLTDTVLAVGYLDGNKVDAHMVARSGTTLTASSPVTIATAVTSNGEAAVTRIGKSSFGIYWRDNSTGVINHFAVVRVTDGTTPAIVGSELVVSSGLNTEPWNGSVQLIAPTLVMFAYEDTGEDDGYAILELTTNFDTVIGIANEDIPITAVGAIVLTGFSNDPSGLTVATRYYVGADGELVDSTENGSKNFGIALATTEISITVE